MKSRFLKRIIAILLSSVILCFACTSPSYAVSDRVFFCAGIKHDDGGNRDWWLNNLDSEIYTIVSNKGYSGSLKTNQLNASEAFEILKNKAGIFAVHTHGTSTSVIFSNGTEMTMSQVNTLSSNALCDVDLVIYGTCEAAKGGKFASNMVNSTFRKGAKVVIGFEDLTYVDQMNQWLLDFFKSYSSGNDVTQSANDGLYWAKFWHFGDAGGTDKVLIRY